MQRIISWNVNGLRAVYKKGFLELLKKLDPHIINLQEIKAQEDQLPFDLKIVDDYVAYFNSAERKGYSGVATYTKEAALNVSNNIGEARFDSEGRSLILEFEKFFLLNVYFPNGQRSHDRVQFKLDYYDKFLNLLKQLEKSGKMILFCGDVNTAHQEIDLARPKENSKTSGFLPEERAYLDKFIANGYVDTFRMFNNDPYNYTWWDVKSRARERNIGWRIDYFFVDEKHKKNIVNAGILKDVMGSDHAPVFVDIEI